MVLSHSCFCFCTTVVLNATLERRQAAEAARRAHRSRITRSTCQACSLSPAQPKGWLRLTFRSGSGGFDIATMATWRGVTMSDTSFILGTNY